MVVSLKTRAATPVATLLGTPTGAAGVASATKKWRGYTDEVEQNLEDYAKRGMIPTVCDFGAYGTGTDDGPKIQKAMDRAGRNVAPYSGFCYMPPGVYRTSVEIDLGVQGKLRGAGRETTQLIRHGSFTGPLVRPVNFDSYIAHMCLDGQGVCNDLVRGTDWNENSGVRECLLVGFLRYGIAVDGTGSPLFPQSYIIEQNEFYMHASAPTSPAPACIYLKNTYPARLSDNTFATHNGTTHSTGLAVKLDTNARVFYYMGEHVEHLAEGLPCASWTTAIGCRFGPNVTVGHRILAGARSVTVIGAFSDGATVTNVILDETDGNYGSGSDSHGLYIIGEGTNPVRLNSRENRWSIFTNLVVTGSINASGASTLNLSGLPAYANDAAAATGGLSVGLCYVNSTTGAVTRRLV